MYPQHPRNKRNQYQQIISPLEDGVLATSAPLTLRFLLTNVLFSQKAHNFNNAFDFLNVIHAGVMTSLSTADLYFGDRYPRLRKLKNALKKFYEGMAAGFISYQLCVDLALELIIVLAIGNSSSDYYITNSTAALLSLNLLLIGVFVTVFVGGFHAGLSDFIADILSKFERQSQNANANHHYRKYLMYAETFAYAIRDAAIFTVFARMLLNGISMFADIPLFNRYNSINRIEKMIYITVPLLTTNSGVAVTTGYLDARRTERTIVRNVVKALTVFILFSLVVEEGGFTTAAWMSLTMLIPLIANLLTSEKGAIATIRDGMSLLNPFRLFTDNEPNDNQSNFRLTDASNVVLDDEAYDEEGGQNSCFTSTQ